MSVSDTSQTGVSETSQTGISETSPTGVSEAAPTKAVESPVTSTSETAGPTVASAAAKAAASAARAREAAKRLTHFAATASVSVAFALVVLKTVAWAKTGSVALLGSLIDSALDAAASGLNLLAVRAAHVPADREHRFGHGKFEAIAGLGQATLILVSALFLAIESIRTAINPRPIEASGMGIGVIVVTVVATLGLVLFQHSVVKRTGSLAISADQLHYTGDLLLNASVILALVLAGPFHLLRADAALGLVVAVLIGRSAVVIFHGALDQLLDRELSDTDRARIREIALAHPNVRNMHELRTRVSGYDTFIQLHIELDPNLPLDRAHAISDDVERKVIAAFPAAQVLIHEDPAGFERTRPMPPSGM